MTDSKTFPIPGFSEFSEIGSGGFGTVYAATEDIFERPVAVKVLRQGLDASDRRRFERECRAMARLSDHPNVVTLYSAGYTVDDRPFIVMELVTEGSLAERLEEKGLLDWRQVQNIGVKVADALSRAHEVGVLHRDIKPANILMVGDEPKLTDFGIASFLDSAGATSTNIAVSWNHAPPETFENIRDERSDLYSLGSTLHTLLTGTPPFSREGEDSVNPLLKRLLNDEPPAIARPDVPQTLRNLISETLRKDPNDRPQTARLMRQRLEELSHVPVTTAGETAVVPFETEPPSGRSATVEFRSAALHTHDDETGNDSRPLSKAPASIGTRRSGRRRKVSTLVALALVLGLAGAGAVELLSRDPVDDGSSDPTVADTEVAGPLAPEVLAPSTTENVTPTTKDPGPSELEQQTESTTNSTPAVAAEESSATTRPEEVATTSIETTLTQPSSQPTSASSVLPAPLSAPQVRLREVSETSLWVQWDPVESAFWYPYRVTVDGDQVESVDTASAVASYFGPRRGNTCIHVTAQNEARTSSSAEGTFCYDTSNE